MKRIKFTQQTATKFKIEPGETDTIVFDDAMPGFGLRVRVGDKGEHRTFIAQYKIGDKHRRITLGDVRKVTLDKARDGAKRIFADVAYGKDPANEKAERRAAASHTLGSMIERYLAARANGLKPRSLVEVKRHLETNWRPLHNLAIASISRAHVSATIEAIAKGGKFATANYARAALSAMFRWAIGAGLCVNNPVVGSNRQDQNGPRERTLSDSEIAKVWLAAPDSDYGNIVKLLILTGCRREEIGNVSWSEVDLDARTLIIPKERSKNGKEHAVPLSETAVLILQGIRRREDRDYVFGIARASGGFAGWSAAKRKLDQSVGFEDWTLHDLRRTVATQMAELGVQPHIIEAVLNHVSGHKGGVAGVYNRATYDREKRDALEKWATHIRIAIAQETGANVTAIRPSG